MLDSFHLFVRVSFFIMSLGFGLLSIAWFRDYLKLRHKPYKKRRRNSLGISLLFAFMTFLVTVVSVGILTGGLQI